MKKGIIYFLIFWVSKSMSQTSQEKFNLDFEQITKEKELPKGWIKWGTFALSVDSLNVQSGKNSLRIENDNTDSFGSIAYELPANFKGKTVTLEGYLKYENVSDGFAGLLLRVDEDGASSAFDNMQNKNLQGTQDWKKYTISLKLRGNPDKIFVGGILTGKGKVWVDNFKVSIDGKPIENLKPIKKELSIVDKDNEFDNGSKIEFTNLSEIQKRNLFVLGKVWGFIKYHHPLIAKGTISWDYELFRILPKISENDFDKELIQWITKLGDFKVERQKLPNVEEVKLLPNTKWIFDTNSISKDLADLLQSVNNAKRNNSNYYIDFYPGVKNPVFTNEKKYVSMKYTDSGVKLLALFRYWNMIEYFFPNRHLIDENWDQVLVDFIPQMVYSKNQEEYTLSLLKLIGKVQDTHANIWRYNKTLESFFGERIVPVKLQFVENKAVVASFYDEYKDGNLKIGDVIVAVDGIKIEDWIKAKKDFFPASNYPTQLRDIAGKLFRTNNKSLIVTISNSDGVKEIILNTTKYKYFKEKEILSHKIVSNDIGYIYPESLKRGEINQIMNKFINKKGLIVDLRCYPSDFIVFSLSKYLLNEKKDFVKFTKGSQKIPGLFDYKNGPRIGGGNKNYFKGKVVILVNEETQSQAEYTAMALRTTTNSVVLGSTTAGADGNVSSIYLPGNIFTFISGIGILSPDGSETQRVGIIPDEKMQPTIKGIKEGKDEVLEKAIEIIKKA